MDPRLDRTLPEPRSLLLLANADPAARMPLPDQGGDVLEPPPGATARDAELGRAAPPQPGKSDGSGFGGRFHRQLKHVTRQGAPCGLEVCSLVLCALPEGSPARDVLEPELKRRFLDHVQDPESFLRLLRAAEDTLEGEGQDVRHRVRSIRRILEVENCWRLPADEAPHAKNRCGAVFESLLATQVLEVPGARLREVVQKVSAPIEAFWRDQDNDDLEIALKALAGETEWDRLPFAFGRFAQAPDLAGVKAALEDQDLARIMFIHFITGRNLLRGGTFSGQVHQGTTLRSLASEALRADDEAVIHMINGHHSASELFQDRGRLHELSYCSQTQLGLCRHAADSALFGHYPYSWSPDIDLMIPDPNSEFVQDMRAKQIVYVSGPSTMTGIMTAVSVVLADLTREESDLYALAIAAYLVAGGLHSFGEAFATLRDRFGLLNTGTDAYEIRGDRAGNYSVPFALFNRDPCFATSLERTWTDYLDWFATIRLAGA